MYSFSTAANASEDEAIAALSGSAFQSLIVFRKKEFWYRFVLQLSWIRLFAWYDLVARCLGFVFEGEILMQCPCSWLCKNWSVLLPFFSVEVSATPDPWAILSQFPAHVDNNTSQTVQPCTEPLQLILYSSVCVGPTQSLHIQDVAWRVNSTPVS